MGEWGKGEREDGELLLMGTVLQDEVTEMDGGDGCTTSRVHLLPLSCTRKNGEDGEFDVMYILPQ